MFFRNIHIRMKVVLIGIFSVFFLIIGKVFYIQVIQYDKLNSLASSLWSRNLPVAADRGLIYDRDLNEIVNNVTTTTLVLIPNQIKDKEQVAKDLSEILEVSYDEMLKHVSKKTSIERVHPEGRKLSYEVADQIDALGYDGVYLLKDSKRNYPYQNTLAHVLGIVGIDNQGITGIELQYDQYLTGEAGAIKYFSDAKGQRLNQAEVYETPQDGMNVVLTIDMDIQASVERELDNVISKYNADQALAIVMNPNNGEILAMSSRPNFSIDNYQANTIEEINRNLPIWATYEPGSTFKNVDTI